MAKGVCARPPGIGDVAGEVVVVDEDTTRVAELELAPRQALHWHYHTNFDRMYCLSGTVVVETRMRRCAMFSCPASIATCRRARPIAYSIRRTRPPAISSCKAVPPTTTSPSMR